MAAPGFTLKARAALVFLLLLIPAERAAARAPFNEDSPGPSGNIIGRAFGFSFSDSTAGLQCVGSVLRWARVNMLVPVLRVTIFLSLVMLVMQITEKLFVSSVSLYAKVFRRKPEKVYEWKPIEEIVETGSCVFPMVLVQIPMYNEKEVYKLCIGAACRLSWPRDRFIIQVLDDSTDLCVKERVMEECRLWAAKGMNIKYEHRDNRKGYKAGALKEGIMQSYVEHCEYIAMFDADFQPEPDFLQRTIPFLVHNPRLALVQSRWKFVNAVECVMTRLQGMSLNYHFKVEQESGSSSVAFFGYNGTAGVWRISAIHDAGGWNDRTTVEDMDLAVRAGLRGWRFVYVGDIKVKSELPSTFKAYRFQQHRWSCGPANLFRKMALEIITNKTVSIWMKFYLLWYFFFVGKIVPHLVTFIFFCTVIPVSVLTPEVHIPSWGLVYAPLVITILKAIETPRYAGSSPEIIAPALPSSTTYEDRSIYQKNSHLGSPSHHAAVRSLHLTVFWVLFENAMSLHRLKAAMIGLFEAGRVNEWIVTEKLGDALKAKPAAEGLDKAQTSENINEPLLPITAIPSNKITIRFWKRFHVEELGWGVVLILCGLYDILVAKKGYFVYVLLQGVAFLVIGFDYVGIHIPTS